VTGVQTCALPIYDGAQPLERMLPSGASFERLRAIVRTYVGDALDYDVNLVLAGQDVPRTCLDGGTRLGQTSWSRLRDAGDDTPRPDADDLILSPGAMAA
jgi:type VI secretion system protein ImpH